MPGMKALLEEEENDTYTKKTQRQMASLLVDGKIHEKLDFLMQRNSGIEEHLKNINGSIQEMKVCLNDHEHRMRGLEANFWKASGGLAALSVLALTKSLGLW
jgi:archaellum component FlaC